MAETQIVLDRSEIRDAVIAWVRTNRAEKVGLRIRVEVVQFKDVEGSEIHEMTATATYSEMGPIDGEEEDQA